MMHSKALLLGCLVALTLGASDRKRHTKPYTRDKSGGFVLPCRDNLNQWKRDTQNYREVEMLVRLGRGQPTKWETCFLVQEDNTIRFYTTVEQSNGYMRGSPLSYFGNEKTETERVAGGDYLLVKNLIAGMEGKSMPTFKLKPLFDDLSLAKLERLFTLSGRKRQNLEAKAKPVKKASKAKKASRKPVKPAKKSPAKKTQPKSSPKKSGLYRGPIQGKPGIWQELGPFDFAPAGGYNYIDMDSGRSFYQVKQ